MYSSKIRLTAANFEPCLIHTFVERFNASLKLLIKLKTRAHLKLFRKQFFGKKNTFITDDLGFCIALQLPDHKIISELHVIILQKVEIIRYRKFQRHSHRNASNLSAHIREMDLETIEMATCLQIVLNVQCTAYLLLLDVITYIFDNLI